MLVQTENKNYVRDTNSRALLAHDRKIVDDYKARKKIFDQAKHSTEEINIIKDRMHNIEKTMDELKGLLIDALKNKVFS